MLAALVWGLAGLATTPLVLKAIVALPERSAPTTAPARGSGRRTAAVAALLFCSFVWVAWRHGVSVTTAALSLYALIFVVIAVIDIDNHLILNRVLAPAALLALALSVVLPGLTPLLAVAGAVAGFVMMLIPALIMRGGLGEGDVKLAGWLGLVTGFPDVLTALAAGIIIGGVVTFALLLARRIGRRQFLPYGPFLLIGAALMLLQW